MGGTAVATHHTLRIGGVTAPTGDEVGAVVGNHLVEIVEIRQIGDRSAFGSGRGTRPVALIAATVGTDTEIVSGVNVKVAHFIRMRISGAGRFPSVVVYGIFNIPFVFVVTGSPVQSNTCGGGFCHIHVRSHTSEILVAVYAKYDVTAGGGAAGATA